MARHVGRVRRVADELFSLPGVGFVQEVAFAGLVGAVPVRMYRYDANALAPTWSAFRL